MSDCKWCKDEVCVNADSPLRADSCENCRHYVRLKKNEGICCGGGWVNPIFAPNKKRNCRSFWKKKKYIDAYTKEEATDVSPIRHGKWTKNKKGDTVCSSCGAKIPMVEMNVPPYDELQYVPFKTIFCYLCGSLMEEWGNVEQFD